VLSQGAHIASLDRTASITESTPGHVTHILTKLGLRDRVEAVVFAYETGLVRRRAADR